MKISALLISTLLCIPAFTQSRLLDKVLRKNEHLFPEVLKNPGKYEVQIIYTQINRDRNNEPHFKTYNYRLKPEHYYYPASTVKMPTALVAMEKLNKLSVVGLDKDADMKHGVGHPLQKAVYTDTTSSTGMPSIAHYVKKVFLVSDNDAHNRLYEFVGQEYLNSTLWTKGFNDVRLLHRLSVSGFDAEANRHTNPVSFNKGDSLLYYQGPVYSKANSGLNLKSELKGKGYYAGSSLVNTPFDFSEKNFIALSDLNEMVKTIIFPNSVPEHQRFLLLPEDYNFIYRVMSELPSESRYPDYSRLPDNTVKFFMFGDALPPVKMPSNIRIFNKVGAAYGYLTDVAYIVDFEKNIEFMLAATIHVNEDGIFNDDKYEYNTIGLPFLANLGKVVYDYEKKRKRKFEPDLSRFKGIVYD